MRRILLLGASLLPLLGPPAAAAEPASCATVRMAEPGWTDLAYTTGVAGLLLEALGYETETQVLGIPVIYQAMENGQLDVFLGYWDPAMEIYYAEFRDRGSVETLRQNLAGAKYTWAVPRYVAEAGVHDIKDLAKFPEKFDKQVYGIEPGSNQLMFDIIADPAFGLAGWEVVESSEQGMLAQVARATQRQEWVAFQAWAPHPMNLVYDLVYLTGGDAYYGPDYGGATVHTQVRKGYAPECPNVAKLLDNLVFTVELESRGMDFILSDGLAPEEAARKTLEADPALLEPWLAGVTTKEGVEGLPAVKAALGL